MSWFDYIRYASKADLDDVLAQLRKYIMTSKQEVLDTIASEKADIMAAIKVLEDKVAAGGATAQDWQDVKDAVQGMYTATPEDGPANPPADPPTDDDGEKTDLNGKPVSRRT